ncbi:hypothetical protein Daus18300_010321 [Diaporthe australafricana]|uniref:Phytanoyl-CoA hydroxylase n=1 Tax=Diaporthe australafricana TaxID=127596 RepID=A0ABR3WB66_9PEZI
MPSVVDKLQSDDKEFFVNDGRLERERIGIIRPTTLDTPLEEMRRRYKEDGHLLVKGLVPREDVLTARRKYFEMLEPTGFLKPGSKPIEGRFNTEIDPLNFPGVGAGVKGSTDERGRTTGPDPETARLFGDLALKAHGEHWYKEDFCKHPAIHEFVAKLMGWGDSTHGITRTLLRNNTPGNKAIGVHYDHIFLRYGEDTFITGWVPIGDIKIDGGGLIYLEKGHVLGKEIEDNFTRLAAEAKFTTEEAKSAYNQNMMGGGLLADGPAAFAKEHNRRWLLSAYEAGDVVFHNAYAVSLSSVTVQTDTQN